MDPTTRPGEMSRIKSLADGDPYRHEVLTMLAIQDARSERQEARSERADAWMIAHDKKDDIAAVKFENRLINIEASIDGKDGLRSGVSDYRDDKSQFTGGKRLAIAAGVFVAAIFGMIELLVKIIEALSKKP